MSKAKQRVVKDVYGQIIETARRKRKVTFPEKRAIQQILKMSPRQAFPRCKYRDWRLAKSHDEKRGYTREQIDDKDDGYHTREGHICPECRCRHVAGGRTRGWWYWGKDNPDGFGEVGHHGVGPCYWHSPHHRARGWGGIGLRDYTQMIMREIRFMQQHGAAPNANGEFLIRVKEDGERSKSINELRDIIGCVKGLMEAMDHDIKALENELDSAEIDAETRIKLKLKYYDQMLRYAKASADITKDEITTSQEDYAHKDEIRILVRQMLLLTENIYRPKGTDEDWNEFGMGMKDVLCGLRMGKRHER